MTDDHSIKSSLTDQGPMSQETTMPVCVDHPDGKYRTGFGYDGGGFGGYKKCRECGRVFAKTEARDGNQ